MSKPTIEQTRMGAEAIAFCIARTLIEREPSLKAPIRANLRKMWELLEAREDHGAAERKPDAAGAAGYECRLAGKLAHGFPLWLEECGIVERLDHGVDHVGGAVVLARLQQLPHLAQIGADRRLE